MSALAGAVMMIAALAYTPDELDWAARTVYGESRGEAYQGKLAVAWTIRNRVERKSWWGRTIKDVVLKPFQFSCWLPDDPNAAKCRDVDRNDPIFLECLRATKAAFGGIEPDPTGGASHYHAGPAPRWAIAATPLAVIGGHKFYKLES